MAAKGARQLTPEQVKVTLVGDTGRGWQIKEGDRDIFVFLELPPFHACSTRRLFTGGIPHSRRIAGQTAINLRFIHQVHTSP